MIDTHAHLYSSQFDEDRADVIEECKAVGISKVLLPNIDSTSIESMLQMEIDFPNYCFPMMGLHPCSVNENFTKELDLVEEWLNKRKFIAIGEVGIDLYWDKTTLPYQQEAFRQQIIWAKEKDLPIIIHARDSFQEIFEIVDDLNDDSLKGIFHCFNGTVEDAKHIIAYGGFKMGIGGVVTFKNAGVDKTIGNFDLDNFVMETDSPYLAPTPYRGKRNKSSYLTLVKTKMSEVFGVSEEEVSRITDQNVNELFNFN